MRMAIGLAGILVTIGVIVWIMSAITLPATKNALDVKNRVTPQVEQMAGHTANGTRAVDTVQVKSEQRNGRMHAIVVTEVVEGAAMDKHFGLRKGDAITEIGPLAVRDMGSTSEAKDFLVAEYQRSGQVTVLRDGKEVKLPLPAKAKAPATPAAAGEPSGGGGDALQKQLDAIPGVPR
jgi:S1-C subfamily serine protease